jgi:hypothetical protein
MTDEELGQAKASAALADKLWKDQVVPIWSQDDPMIIPMALTGLAARAWIHLSTSQEDAIEQFRKLLDSERFRAVDRMGDRVKKLEQELAGVREELRLVQEKAVEGR